MTRHIRHLLALLIVGACCSKAIAAHVTYAFNSAETGLYGEVTFEDTNENFAPGATVTYWNGAVVEYWFRWGDFQWDYTLQFYQDPVEPDGFHIQFDGNGTGPDNIITYGFLSYTVSDTAPNFEVLSFSEDVTTNGHFEFYIANSDLSGPPLSDLVADGTDGTFSLAPPLPNSVELCSVILEDNGDVRVAYNKNFVDSVYLYRESPLEVTHTADLFSDWGLGVVVTNPASDFSSLTAGERVFLSTNDAVTVSNSVTVTNRPVADAGPDQTVECTGVTLVQLDGTASYDPNGDAITMYWMAPANVFFDDPFSPTPIASVPDGVTMVTLVVTDENGASRTDDVVITVYDDVPPQVACTTNIATLSPADHEMVAVEVYIVATDACDTPEELQLVQVTATSSEPDDARSNTDGATTGDTNGLDGYIAPVDVTSQFAYYPDTRRFEGTVYLRAEADTKGTGRSYGINATVTDASGNRSSAGCVVVVPLDRTTGGGNGGNGHKK